MSIIVAKVEVEVNLEIVKIAVTQYVYHKSVTQGISDFKEPAKYLLDQYIKKEAAMYGNSIGTVEYFKCQDQDLYKYYLYNKELIDRVSDKLYILYYTN